MKANTNQNNKKSARKKLIPAVSMLTVSAIMLSTATYAWFTMNKEVEVTGMKLTATVPEDLQISLGALGTTNAAAAGETDNVSLANSTGVLVKATSSATSADNGDVLKPTDNAWDWSNTADISKYYDFGRLIPASSTDGANIYFTPGATGVGKTVSSTASYYAATKTDSNLEAATDGNTVTTTGVNKTYETTLHAKTASDDEWATKTSGGYTQSTAWNVTYDDGYYVDIPIWIRTSSNTAVKISVDGYVLPGSVADGGSKATDLEIYKAVRVALLNGEDVTADNTTGAAQSTAGSVAVAEVTAGTANNIIPLKNAWNSTDTTTDGVYDSTTSKYKKIQTVANPFANDLESILDSINLGQTTTTDRTRAMDLNLTTDKTDFLNATKLAGVSALKSATDATDSTPSYIPATYKIYNALTPTSAGTSASAVATIAGSTTSGTYGDAKKLIVRIWLDGEDGECWNDNAGQDFSISLKFTKITASS